MDIENEVLGRVSPSPARRKRVEKAAKTLLAHVLEAINDTGLPLEATLQGSVAKDTYTSTPDIDVFVLFPESTSRKDLETVGLGIGKSVLGGEERYAEHPYVHGIYSGYEVDLVPCFRISSPVGLKSAVDRTPFHTTYIKSHLAERQKADVRLLKQFMKGIGAYGAEAKVQGFSGYLVELLVLRYGDFRSVLAAAGSWKKGEVLDLEGGGERFDTPLVFYDPVDSSRNVASAVSMDSMACFQHAAKAYLDSPSIRFFFPRAPKTWPLPKIKKEMDKRGTGLLVVSLKRPKLIDDDLFPQMKKTAEGLQAALEAGEFSVVATSTHPMEGRVDLVFELMAEELPRVMKHVGPPVWIGHAVGFLEKWSGKAVVGPYIENGRWVALVERKYRRAPELVRGEATKAALGSSFRDLAGMEVRDTAGSLKADMKRTLSRHLDRTLPWER